MIRARLTRFSILLIHMNTPRLRVVQSVDAKWKKSSIFHLSHFPFVSRDLILVIAGCGPDSMLDEHGAISGQ